VRSHISQYLDLQMEFLSESKLKILFWDITKPTEPLLVHFGKKFFIHMYIQVLYFSTLKMAIILNKYAIFHICTFLNDGWNLQAKTQWHTPLAAQLVLWNKQLKTTQYCQTIMKKMAARNKPKSRFHFSPQDLNLQIHVI
jgi:hypothetical protein